ncbi:MAG: hypothetical protein SNG10_00590 [Rikenellaceae bacterium]
MFKYIVSLLFAVATIPYLYADTQGDAALKDLSTRLREMGSYESGITITTQGSTIEGSYFISAENYHIDMGSVEFWGVGDRRYEVSHKIEEIVIEGAQQGDNMLLNNPSQAFDFVGQGFDTTLSQQGEDVILQLTPSAKNEGEIDVDMVIIHLDSSSLLPTKIIYKADTDTAEVLLHGIKKSKKTIDNFDLSKYKRYEIIDLY